MAIDTYTTTRLITRNWKLPVDGHHPKLYRCKYTNKLYIGNYIFKSNYQINNYRTIITLLSVKYENI